MFFVRLLKNPTVRRILIWAAPFIISYVTSKLEDALNKKDTRQSGKTTGSSKKRS